jgi:tRNA-splicing ligase RtcB
MLPGVMGRALAMPDVHQGYGAPVGGVFACDAHSGIVSPGACGYDINCGVRLLRSDLAAADVLARQEALADSLFKAIPSGLGSHKKIKLDERALDRVFTRGAAWAVDEGYGWRSDLDRCESEGALPGAEPQHVGPRARQRGSGQVGELGSGNHFCQVDVVDHVDDPEMASMFDLAPGQVVVWIHTGSRGLGHQVCTDYLQTALAATAKYGIQLPDRQLACMPIGSPEGRAYLGAMASAANFGWANRQVLSHYVRESFAQVLGAPAERLGLQLVYDVTHNVAKFERHRIPGEPTADARDVLVHRKGATRAFPAGHQDVPEVYRRGGQPVLVPGDMGRHSFVLVGAEGAMAETYGSLCHGAGRNLSRGAARRQIDSRSLLERLRAQGILVRAGSPGDVAEEAPEAYKDAAQVVAVAAGAGLARVVARTRPLIVIKG